MGAEPAPEQVVTQLGVGAVERFGHLSRSVAEASFSALIYEHLIIGGWMQARTTLRDTLTLIVVLGCKYVLGDLLYVGRLGK